MRKLASDGKLEQVICNSCGKKLQVINGILQEGCFCIQYNFDYFSKKDGQIHRFDLCEDCYDKMTARFQVPVETEEETELL